jgi:guanylate kinase
MPPSVPELEKRLLGRATDDRERIKTRIEKAKEEIKQSDRFDNIIVNDNLSQAKQEVYQIVKSYLDH